MVEVDVRVAAQLLNAGTVHVDAADVQFLYSEPRLQLMIVQMNFTQLLYAVETSQTIAEAHYPAGNAAAYAGDAFQFRGVGTIQ